METDDNEDVAVISSGWIDAARTTAAIPRLPGSAYYRYAQNHLQPKSVDPKLPVIILVTTEQAREIDVRCTSGNLRSSDDAINISLLMNHQIKQPRFAADENEECLRAEKRKCEPTVARYSVPSCSTEHQRCISCITYGAQTIIHNNSSEET